MRRRRNDIGTPRLNPASKNNGNDTYVYRKIRSYQNSSLIQKRGGMVEAIPASLFPVIREYLMEQDYRNLMNTNLAIFQDIKHETVRYTFPSLFEWRKVGRSMNPPISLPTIINYISSLIEMNVKYLSKQVSIRMQGFIAYGFDDEVRLDNMYFEELYKLSRCRKVIFRNCPCIPDYYFNNIYHVVIDFNDFIDPFPPGLKNISILEIRNCDYLSDIKNIDDIDGLQQLIIVDSGRVDNFCNFERIPVVRLDWQSWVRQKSNFSLPGNIFPQFSFLQELILKINFQEVESSVYQCFVKIPVLGLHHSHGSSRPVLPVVLQARVLEITNFEIVSWEGANFTNLEMLRLENCFFEGVDRLSSSFTVLHTLEILEDCNIELSTLSSLRRLRVKSFHMLGLLPASLSFLSLESFQLPDSLECFATIPKLEFFNCFQLSSLVGLGHLNREVKLYNCESVVDFKPLQHTYKLHLEQMTIQDTKWFSNVKHLSIVDCTSSLTTVVNLEHVETLYISGCPLLTELPDYERVKISVWNCPNLVKYGEGVTFLKSPGHVAFEPLERTVNFPFKGYKPL
jgi:hypothetical protein